MRTPEWVWVGIAEGTWPLASRPVYAYMLARRNAKTGRCTASLERMAADLGCGTTALKGHVAELQRLGLIVKEVVWNGRVRHNAYVVNVFAEAPGTLARRAESVSRQTRRRTDNDGRNPSSSTGRNPSSNSPYGSSNSRGQSPANGDTPTTRLGATSAFAEPSDSHDDETLPVDVAAPETLPHEALVLVGAWHLAEDAHLPVVVTDSLDGRGCSGCGCRLAIGELMCTRCTADSFGDEWTWEREAVL